MITFKQNTFYFIDLGLKDYNQSLIIQKYFHNLCLNSDFPGVILFVEHPSTITLGKHCDESDYILEKEFISKLKVPVVRTERGGKITAHEPHQLVVYPIFNILDSIGFFPKEYVSFLENSIITLLKKFGIDSYIDPKLPGVWVKNNKIAAIGIRIKDRISTHGIAINVSNNLELFKYIIPCGIKEKGVSSILKEIQNSKNLNYDYDFLNNHNILMNSVKEELRKILESRLGSFIDKDFKEFENLEDFRRFKQLNG